MRILVCGSRDMTSKAKNDIHHVLAMLSARYADEWGGDITIVEGCARGADRWAEEAAEGLGLNIEHHPADWNRYGQGAGFKRNREMLASGIDLVIAFWDGKSKGTKHTMDEAEKKNIPVHDYYAAKGAGDIHI